LRPDQHEALDNLRAAIAEGNKHIVMQAPTGYGKTVLSAELVNSARSKGKKVLFVVPAISLVDQTVEMFASQGIGEVGVIQANHRQTDGCMPVQVASVQTLQRRDMPPADVIVLDEVHRWFNAYGTWLRTPGVWLEKPVIGLSATPWHKVLGCYFGKLVKASTTQELIDGGLLSDFKVFASDHPDLEGIATVAGDYHEGELAERMSNVKLVANIVETWLEHGRGRPTLCFAVDRCHAKHLQKQFEDRGVKAAYQDAFTTPHDRAAIKTGFHDGSIEVVVNIGTLTTGIDWDVRCIILARPTKSEMLFVQIMGRGLRTASGKDHLLCLDHTDNHLRLGFVTDIDANHDELLNKADRVVSVTDKIRLPKECPACNFLKPPGTAKCPSCGFIAVKHNKIEPTAGELKEIERKRKAAENDINPAVFFSELLAYGIERGYNPGWAANKYREKFGVWPNGLKGTMAAREISAKTRSWIKSRNIAWAKSKHRFSTA
jgi:superfamily II DNA or RNA helicase